MENKLYVKNTVIINAPAAIVWKALVNPEQTKKYMFGCAAVSDWKVGSPLLWSAEQEGKEIVYVKGKIVDIKSEKFLEYTTIDPYNTAIPDVPENYLNVTYKLSEANGQTIFTATQGDYSKVAEGAARYKETVDGGGWQPILEAIKKLVEEGED